MIEERRKKGEERVRVTERGDMGSRTLEGNCGWH